jgi:multiple antibiotic resistance protein
MWQYALEIFVTLFAVINPVSIIPMFVGLTNKATPREKKLIAFRGVLIAGIILLSFAFLGDLLLNWLGISKAAFNIAGGLLLLNTAFNMVLAKPSGMGGTTPAENKEAESKEDISIFPLAIPLIADPGSISTVILLTRGLETRYSDEGIVVFILLFIMVITYICLRLSEPIAKLLGVTATNTIDRVFGIILAALSIQFVLDGISMYMKTPVLQSILSQVIT